MTYQQALQSLPVDVSWSCSFGYPGEDRYTEFWRDASGVRYTIARDDAYDVHGWRVACVLH